MYQQVLDPVSNSLGLSCIFAVLPLVVLFVLLGVVRMPAWIASLISLVVALAVAVFVYPMPVDQALRAGAEGAIFGFFPILWIVINALWIYNMTVATGHFDVLRRSFGRVSDDSRIQGVIIAFCFGALLEALAGFGTPVAITSVMLIALGFRPVKAATVALVANTAPVAFGALAVPITTLATVTGLPESDLGSMVGRQTPILGVFVPIALVFIIDGARGVKQTLPATLICGFSFGIVQFATSNYISVPLTDIVAALVSVVATVAFLRVWKPTMTYRENRSEDRELVGAGAGAGAGAAAGSGRSGLGADESAAARSGASAGVGTQVGANASEAGAPGSTSGSTHDTDDVVARAGRGAEAEKHDPPAEVFRAYAPYLLIILVFVIAQIGPVKDALTGVTKTVQWPGLDVVSSSGKPSTLTKFKFDWLDASGTLLLITGLLTIPVLRISPARALKAYGATLKQLATAIVTVMAVLALAYVMNLSGQTGTLGTWMAQAGGAFALISPILGWLGVAVTGSDTSSNSLFGALQITAANQAGLSPLLMAGANSSGGVLGKMISPQNLAIAAAAVGMQGKEGDLFRKVIGWSVLFVALMCVLVYLQSTSVLSWMVPG
ncbi:MAG: lactate permease [Frankiaceae bacterium]|nr:lactate permease [Frankiaceae bacterium]